MGLQSLYQQYVHLKYGMALSENQTGALHYARGNDESVELFFEHSEESFCDWAYELQPEDPNYTTNSGRLPVAHARFQQMDVYDEQIMYYLLFTINSTLSIPQPRPYLAMNDLMKNYAFFQLAQVEAVGELDERQKRSLREFLLFFYLYAHPVNEETLYAFSFDGQELVHVKTGIKVSSYFEAYHDYYSSDEEISRSCLTISSRQIGVFKQLSLELVQSLEGRLNPRLAMPTVNGWEEVVEQLNDANGMLKLYNLNKSKLLDLIRTALSREGETLYGDYCIRMLIQNLAVYILFFDFSKIRTLLQGFKDDALYEERFVNHLFGDTIFMQKIIREQRIDLALYPDVTALFKDEARRIYL